MSNSTRRILVYGLVASKTFGGIGSFLTEMNRHMSGNTVFDYVIEGSGCSIQDRIEPIKIAVSLDRVVTHSHNSRLLVNDAKHRIIYKINKARLSRFNVIRLSCSKKATEFMCSPDNKVQFIHNAVDLDAFKFDRNDQSQVRSELKIPDKTKIIGFVGRLVDQKNVLFLPDILNSVIKHSDIDVVMIALGEGYLKKQLLEKIEQYNLQNHFLFLGDHADIYRYYHAMDVFILPSLFEGLPIVMVEAQVAGLPCIVSDAITSESNISGNVTFLPINDASLWGEVISDKLNNKNTNRGLLSEKLKDSDFDINHEALRLESILTGH